MWKSPDKGFFILTVAALLLILGGWGALYLCVFNGQQGADQTGVLVAGGLLLAGTVLVPFGMLRCRGTRPMEMSPQTPEKPEVTPEKNSEELLRVTEILQALSLRMGQASNAVVVAAEAQANGAIDTSVAVGEINENIAMTSGHLETLTEFSTSISSSTYEMSVTIREVSKNMEQLLDSANSVNAAATQLATTIHAIDNSVELLNETSQTTAAAIMQMDATLHEVDESVRSTVAIADTALRDAEGGKSAVDAAVVGMQDIQRASAITAEVMKNLSRRAGDIGSILSVIDELAGRTNLLALNASIIAAQAGQYGNAFAVVAEEIKILATKTKESTSEITFVIEGVQNETTRAIKAIEETELSVDAGVKRSRQSGESLDKIVAGIRQVADQISMIARAASEQTHGIYDIRRAMETMTTMMEQIGKAAREQTLASDAISTAITSMRGVTAQVQSATLEQSSTSSLIADSAAQMLKLAHQSLAIGQEQKEDSNKIGRSVEEILESTDRNLDIARNLDHMLVELQENVVTLREIDNRRF